MATQTVQLGSVPGLTSEAKLYALGSTTASYTASSVTETPVLSGLYNIVFSEATPIDGDFRIIVTSSSTGISTYKCSFTGTDGEVLQAVEFTEDSSSSGGSGSNTVVTNVAVSGNPKAGVSVWVTTDLAGTNVVAGSLSTDSFGNVTFYLDAGTFYVWARLAGINFSTNPTSVVVPTSATVEIIGTPATSSTGYCTVAQVRNYKVSGNYISTLNNYSDEEIQAEIDLADSFIDIITNTWFNQRNKTVYYDGNGLLRQFLFPEIPAPVVEITSVEDIADDRSVIGTWVEGTDFLVHEHYLERIVGANGSPRLTGNMYGSVWPKGQKNVKVVGIFGQATGEVPPPISRASLLMTLERLVPGSTNMAPTDVAQAVWSDFTVTFRAATPENRIGMSTGFDAIDRLIQPYVNHVDMFMVVPDKRQLYDESIFRSYD